MTARELARSTVRAGKHVARSIMPEAAYRRYRRRHVASLRAAYEPHVVERSYGGHRLKVMLTDPMAEAWYDRDWELPRELEFLRERGVLGEGRTVFELGAHHGIVALMLSRIVGPSGRVLAVEAEAPNFRTARENAALNDAGNLTVLHAAASETCEPVPFAEGLNGRVDPNGHERVEGVTIDRLAEQHGAPDVVYLDVEGYEERALRGAAQTLAARRTAFFVEVHETLPEFGGTPEGVIALFDGYELSFAEDGAEFGEERPEGRFFLVAVPAGVPASR